MLNPGYHPADEPDLDGLLAFAHGREVRSTSAEPSRGFPRSRCLVFESQNAVKVAVSAGTESGYDRESHINPSNLFLTHHCFFPC